MTGSLHSFKYLLPWKVSVPNSVLGVKEPKVVINNLCNLYQDLSVYMALKRISEAAKQACHNLEFFAPF